MAINRQMKESHKASMYINVLSPRIWAFRIGPWDGLFSDMHTTNRNAVPRKVDSSVA